MKTFGEESSRVSRYLTGRRMRKRYHCEFCRPIVVHGACSSWCLLLWWFHKLPPWEAPDKAPGKSSIFFYFLHVFLFVLSRRWPYKISSSWWSLNDVVWKQHHWLMAVLKRWAWLCLLCKGGISASSSRWCILNMEQYQSKHFFFVFNRLAGGRPHQLL